MKVLVSKHSFIICILRILNEILSTNKMTLKKRFLYKLLYNLNNILWIFAIQYFKSWFTFKINTTFCHSFTIYFIISNVFQSHFTPQTKYSNPWKLEMQLKKMFWCPSNTFEVQRVRFNKCFTSCILI